MCSSIWASTIAFTSAVTLDGRPEPAHLAIDPISRYFLAKLLPPLQLTVSPSSRKRRVIVGGLVSLAEVVHDGWCLYVLYVVALTPHRWAMSRRSPRMYIPRAELTCVLHTILRTVPYLRNTIRRKYDFHFQCMGAVFHTWSTEWNTMDYGRSTGTVRA